MIANYNWLRSSDALRTIDVPTPTPEDPDATTPYNLGNTIQNGNAHKLTTTLNMDLFYKYIGLTGKKKARDNAPKPAPKPGEKVAAAPTTSSGGQCIPRRAYRCCYQREEYWYQL